MDWWSLYSELGRCIEVDKGGGRIVDKIHNCCHEISVWRKDNLPYEKEKINTLQKTLEVQNDMTKSHEEMVEVSRKLKEAYRDEELYLEQKSRNTWHIYGNRNTKVLSRFH